VEKKKILLFTDWYEPGFKAGGPIRSCVNFVDNMKEAYAIDVFTSDRDLGAVSPYKNIQADQWNILPNDVRIYYCSPAMLNRKNIKKQLINASPAFIYLNSMFSWYYTVCPLLISRRLERNVKIILSTRGMLRASALAFKPIKKSIFLKAFRLFGLFHSIHFLASDQTENTDIAKQFGPTVKITTIPNFGVALGNQPGITQKKAGELFMIFVGRIHPIKNLDYLLSLLRNIKAHIRLSIVGAAEDQAYWQQCESLIAKLPENIAVKWEGERPNNELPALIASQHIFVLPTKGENFGHAIFEALALGKPVLISDQTPWKNLQAAGAGWDIPLDRSIDFVTAIEQAAALDQYQYNALASEAFNFAKRHNAEIDIPEKYKMLFS
jgi:glycosyltransferase involved in cell wall biosynthesis